MTQPLHVYLRLGDDISSGQHPANNSYPTNAWEVGEIVPDFHQLPRPRLFTRKAAIIEVALAPLSPLYPSWNGSRWLRFGRQKRLSLSRQQPHCATKLGRLS
ncbi:MAG: hypothetical protein M5U34_03205 [Chloroflexi bacterium]|nr:hypothetical protein [Chloroflexota bacterium]